MDTEEISDGEVFPSDVDDDEDKERQEVAEQEENSAIIISTKPVEIVLEVKEKVDKTEAAVIVVNESEDRTTTQPINYIDSLVEEVEPISSPPQDANSDVEDNSLLEMDLSDFEEISDEEIEFPEYDYGEWEENWAHKFSRPFNPFSDSFEILPLKVCDLKVLFLNF
jgi:hypothetical protein